MKKIFVLIISIFLLTGCYDNIDLNELAIISAVGIDYYDDNFQLTYEILNDIKTENNSAMLSYTIEGEGKNISEAFANANYKVGKKAYFAHLKIVILSQSVIDDKLNEISDYLLRDTNIRDEFIAMVSKDCTPSEILKHNSDNYPVVSDLITNLIDNEKYNNNLATNETYQKVVSKLISNNYDAVLSSITLKNNEISLSNFYIFKNYNYQNTLTIEESTLYNLLTKNVFSLEFSKDYDDKDVTITINHSNSSFEVTSDKININLKLEGKILENDADFNLKNDKTYQKLNKDFGNLIKKEVEKFIKKLQDNKSDVLGFQEVYYKSTRKDNQNLWTTADINVNVDLKINTKGFIFEVKE